MMDGGWDLGSGERMLLGTDGRAYDNWKLGSNDRIEDRKQLVLGTVLVSKLRTDDGLLLGMDNEILLGNYYGTNKGWELGSSERMLQGDKNEMDDGWVLGSSDRVLLGTDNGTNDGLEMGSDNRIEYGKRLVLGTVLGFKLGTDNRLLLGTHNGTFDGYNLSSALCPLPSQS